MQALSTAQDGTLGNGSSSFAHLSADGRFLYFSSEASNLVEGDTNGFHDAFRKDLQTGEVTRISITADGTQPNNFSFAGSASADGRFVSFWSEGSNLVAGDTNNQFDVFVKDMQTGLIIRANTTADGKQAGGASESQLSADGRFVLFSSRASNLVPGDTNNDWDIFRKDLQTGAITRLDYADSTEANVSSRLLGLYADDRFALFWSDASNLVPDDTNGARDLFVKDLQTGTTTRIDVTAGGTTLDRVVYGASMTDNGRFVLIYTRDLSAGFRDGPKDIFVKDLQTGALTQVNTNVEGTPYPSGTRDYSSATITEDGRYVAFTSTAASLVPLAPYFPAEQRLYVKDLQTGGIVRVGIGTSPQISADGLTVIFENGQVFLADVSVPSPIFGTEGDDSVAGTPQADTLFGRAGSDTLSGGAGNDLLSDDSGDDSLAGGVGDDTLRGRIGDDTLAGGDGDDTLVGGIGDDSLAGGDGDDDLQGGTGDDSLAGGSGNDVLSVGTNQAGGVEPGGGNGTLDGGSGDDTISGRDGDDVLNGGSDDDRLAGGSGADTMKGGSGNDDLEGGDGDDVLDGGSGDDTLNGGSGFDGRSPAGDNGLFGGDGNDSIAGGPGDDTIKGGDGNDSVFGYDGDDRVDGGSGRDTLAGFEGDDILFGGDGDDSLFGNTDNDTVFGGDGNDTLEGGLDNDLLMGGDGNDQLSGGVSSGRNAPDTSEDTLFGGNGDDVLIGGSGQDTLRGGSGADVYTFLNIRHSSASTPDVIAGFHGAGAQAIDVIDLSGVDADGTRDGNQAFTFLGAAAAFTAVGQIRLIDDGDATLLLANTNPNFANVEFAIRILDGDAATAADYTADDFIL